MKQTSTSYSAALLTLGGAAIHFAAAPEHFSEYLPYGVFFVGLGVAQVSLAMWIIFAPGRRLYAAALLGTLAVIGLWLASRTVGLPIAPVPWRPEAVGFPDVSATLLESVSCVLFALRLRGPMRRRGRVRVVVKTVPSFVLALLAGYLGVGSALTPMPDAYNVAPWSPGKTSLVHLVAPDGDQPIRAFTLTAAVTNINGHQSWAYNGTVPGPELRVTQGDRVRVTLVNHLPAATSIHWHGIRVPNAEDGVAGITQDAVKPGATYVYEFIASDPGTFWYHSHQDTSNQIPRGLLGAMVVEPRAGNVAEKRDYTLLIHAPARGDGVAVNGSTNLQLDADPGDTVRLRLINGAALGFAIDPQFPVLVGAPYAVVALDGHDLNHPQQLGPERIALGMGQRADLVFTMPANGSVRVVGIKGANVTLPIAPRPARATVTIGNGPAPVSIDPAKTPQFDFTKYGLPAADPVTDATTYDVNQRIVLAGAPMFRDGGFDFADTFNGKASPLVPPIRVHEGDLVHLRIVNPTAHAAHPIHIHGHIFSVLAKNGHRLSGSPVHLDAILVGPDETWDVAFKADNPGIWMLHCHILAHAASGMSMTINYDGISTPFAMGSRSGNIPE